MRNRKKFSELSQKELEDLLKESLQELEDLDLEWEMNFSLTGVHLNPGDREQLKKRLEKDRQRVQERVEKIKIALKKKEDWEG